MARYGEPNGVGQAATAATLGGAAVAAGGAAYAAGKHGEVKANEGRAVAAERKRGQEQRKYNAAVDAAKKANPAYKQAKGNRPNKRFTEGRKLVPADEARLAAKTTANEAKTALQGSRKAFGRGVKTAIGGAGLALAGGGLNEYLRSRRIRQEREAGKSRFSEAFGALKAQHGAQDTPVRDKHKEIAALAPKRPPEGSRTFAENPATGKHEEQKSARVKAWEDSWRKQLGEDS